MNVLIRLKFVVMHTTIWVMKKSNTGILVVSYTGARFRLIIVLYDPVIVIALIFPDPEGVKHETFPITTGYQYTDESLY